MSKVTHEALASTQKSIAPKKSVAKRIANSLQNGADEVDIFVGLVRECRINPKETVIATLSTGENVILNPVPLFNAMFPKLLRKDCHTPGYLTFEDAMKLKQEYPVIWDVLESEGVVFDASEPLPKEMKETVADVIITAEAQGGAGKEDSDQFAAAEKEHATNEEMLITAAECLVSDLQELGPRELIIADIAESVALNTNLEPGDAQSINLLLARLTRWMVHMEKRVELYEASRQVVTSLRTSHR